MGGCSSKGRQAIRGRQDAADCWWMCERDSGQPAKQRFTVTKPSPRSKSIVKNPFLRSHDNESCTSNEHETSEEAEKHKMIDSIMKQLLLDGSTASKKARAQLGTNLKSRGIRGISQRDTWIVVPDPLPKWSLDEQHAFIEILNDHPKAGRDSVQMEMVMTRQTRLYGGSPPGLQLTFTSASSISRHLG